MSDGEQHADTLVSLLERQGRLGDQGDCDSALLRYRHRLRACANRSERFSTWLLFLRSSRPLLAYWRGLLGGITGPVIFGQLIGTGDRGTVLIEYLVAVQVKLMIEVKAERRSLESVAAPLTGIRQRTTASS